MIRGSCLCGGVQFEIEEAVGPFELCHCPRCRKTSGSAFVAGLGVRSKDFRLTSGSQLIRTYEAPIRERPPAYRVAFCSRCGSPVPDPPADAKWLEIPAGLLDADPLLRPDKHIFVECKSDWFRISDSLPQLTKAQLARQRQPSDHPSGGHEGSSLLRESSKIDLLAFDVEAHLPLLRRWLREPHVRRWWGDPDANLRESLQRPQGGGHAVIAIDGAPVGYICWQPYRREDLEILGESDIAEGSIDVDLMIGEVAHVGEGAGPRALEILVEELRGDASVPLVGVCTSVENTRAIRAFEKVGFSRLREYDDPEFGRCWFMALRAR